MKTHRSGLLTGFVIFAVLVATCMFVSSGPAYAAGKGKVPKSLSEPSSDPSPDPWSALGVEKIGPVNAPLFKLKDIEGREVSLEDLKGSVVLLNFWATWCSPCKEEMPYFEDLHKSFADKGLRVVAINDYEPKQKAVDFIKKHGYTFQVLIDESGRVSESYRAMFLPTTFIIDAESMAVGRASGLRDWSSPAGVRLMEELLKK